LAAERGPHRAATGSPQQSFASTAENILDRFQRNCQMVRVAGKGKKAVFQIEASRAIVDCLHFDRSKSDLARNADATLEGVEKEKPSQSFGALGLGYGQSRQEEARHGMPGNPLSNSGGAFANSK
jgi:hypothetical protein